MTGLLILNMCCPFLCRASSLGNKYKELYCSLCEHILIREFSNRHLQEISTSALVNRRIVNLKETVPRPAQNKQAIIPSFLSLKEKWCQLYEGKQPVQLCLQENFNVSWWFFHIFDKRYCLIWNMISSGSDLLEKVTLITTKAQSVMMLKKKAGLFCMEILQSRSALM